MTELETMLRAKLYIDKLAQGIDPVTERELTGDSVLNHVRVVRCLFYVSGVLQQVIDNGGVVGQTPKRKEEFTITPQQLSAVRPVEDRIGITEFTKLLHKAAGDPERKLPKAVRLTNWLAEKGFLETEVLPDGKRNRVPTAAGRSIGIHTQKRHNDRGEYKAVLYDKQAQQFLLDHYWEIVAK